MTINYDSHTREQLINALRDQATKGSRGTIVYHLWSKKFDCSDIIPELIDCIINGSFEEVNHSLRILEEQAGSFDNQTAIDNAIDELECAPDKEDWREDAMGHAHDYLTERSCELSGTGNEDSEKEDQSQ